jgi:hypothetical protein
MRLTRQQYCFKLRLRLIALGKRFDDLQRLGRIAEAKLCVGMAGRLRRLLAELESRP